MTPIYAASEENVYGIDAEKLCQSIAEHGHRDVRCAASLEHALEMAKEAVSEADNSLLLTLGAGDVWRVSEKFLDAMREA